ncbi:unnamed protein product, partial [Brenthis ino]
MNSHFKGTEDLLIKNKYAQITNIIKDCLKSSKVVSDNTIKKLFRTYSMNGRIDAVEILQKYCSKLNPCLNKRNGEFLHYLAKAHCMKGNSENGLLILKEAYVKHEGLRSFYRVIFRELIYDSVQNRSEASLVIFTKYVLIFSEIWNDNYPLICFWHTCWSSFWFSDQMLSNDLLENSEVLRKIVQDKATTFCINILKEYNEDAVVRLLQTLLKYQMMVEYAKVLNILFNYKLQNRDLRGCTEIVKNCDALGISLSSYQQGRYIKLLINSKTRYCDLTRGICLAISFVHCEIKKSCLMRFFSVHICNQPLAMSGFVVSRPCRAEEAPHQETFHSSPSVANSLYIMAFQSFSVANV